MGVNKVIMNTENGEETLIDLTEDSVTPETLAEGETSHDASGNRIVGVGKKTSVLYTEQNLTDEQQRQARNNIGAIDEDRLGEVKEYLELSIPYINKLYTVESYEDIVNLHNALGVDELVVINVGEAFDIPIVRRSVSSGLFGHGEVYRLKFIDENGETYVNVLEIIDTVPIEDNAGYLMKYTIDDGEGNVTEHSVLTLQRGGKDGETPTITVDRQTDGVEITINEESVFIPYAEDGDGISGVRLNDDYSLTFITNLGHEFTTGSVRGEKGESVTITNIKESTAANGTSVVTFSDGKTLSIKNGRNGASGNTPVKGVDYFTPAEIEEIVNDAAADAAELVNVPTKLSELSGDSTHRTVTDAEKTSWNAKSNFSGAYADLSGKPTKVSAFENDKGYLTSFTESDPTVPSWAKQSTKPSYTASEVGADASGTANSKVSAHNTNTSAHNDIRLLITGLTERLNALADSDDSTLDQMSEIVAYIKANKSLIDSITDTKVNVADIINNLTTNVSNKPLSAAQGVELRNLINAITVPTKLSELSADSTHRLVTDTEKAAWNNKSDFSGKYADLTGQPTIPTVPTKVSAFTNDAGYLTSYTETDPTVPSWAKASSKPSYSKSEVGLGNVENVKQYSASNPPPYPVTSVNGKTGTVTITVPTKTSELTNNSGFLTSHQDISGKADKSSAETWTFTLKSGGTVTKKVVLA